MLPQRTRQSRLPVYGCRVRMLALGIGERREALAGMKTRPISVCCGRAKPQWQFLTFGLALCKARIVHAVIESTVILPPLPGSRRQAIPTASSGEAPNSIAPIAKSIPLPIAHGQFTSTGTSFSLMYNSRPSGISWSAAVSLILGFGPPSISHRAISRPSEESPHDPKIEPSERRLTLLRVQLTIVRIVSL